MLALFAVALLFQNKPGLSCPAEMNSKLLDGANIIEVRDGSEGDLAPDHERNVKGGVEQVWDLDDYRSGSKLLLRCHFRNTKEPVTRDIPSTIHHCTKIVSGATQRITCN